MDPTFRDSRKPLTLRPFCLAKTGGIVRKDLGEAVFAGHAILTPQSEEVRITGLFPRLTPGAD